MSNLLADLQREIAALSAGDQVRVQEYVAYLHWRTQQRDTAMTAQGTRSWRMDLLELLSTADVRATRGQAGMEVKAAEATVGSERRPALWEHPPVQGEAIVEYHVAIPAGLHDVRLQFAIGIREGTEPGKDRLVAFRVRIDGWQVWSRAAWPVQWEMVEVPLPLQDGNVVRLTFATDGLGAHQWAWAVWGEPALLGVERGT